VKTLKNVVYWLSKFNYTIQLFCDWKQIEEFGYYVFSKINSIQMLMFDESWFGNPFEGMKRIVSKYIYLLNRVFLIH
jgi:hypothetical protein